MGLGKCKAARRSKAAHDRHYMASSVALQRAGRGVEKVKGSPTIPKSNLLLSRILNLLTLGEMQIMSTVNRPKRWSAVVGGEVRSKLDGWAEFGVGVDHDFGRAILFGERLVIVHVGVAAHGEIVAHNRADEILVAAAAARHDK